MNKEQAKFIDKNNILNSQNIGSFQVETKCLCISPKNGKINLVFENKDNEVWIFDNS